MRFMRLEQLLKDIGILRLHGGLQRRITGLAYHSAKVREGTLFVAIKGSQIDGHEFVHQAIAQGAQAVVVEKPMEAIPGVTVIQVGSARAALARLSTRFYGFPSRNLKVIGITGTNGKTTTTYLVESILTADGEQVGVIGTVNIRYPGHECPAAVTTPESLDLQKTLRQMLDAGVTHVLLEVTSHALDMHRVDGTRFAVGLFTNLSQDHLDYHGTMEEYFEVKSRLFSQILQTPGDTPSIAVLNGDDPWCQRIADRIDGPLLRYGVGADMDVRAEKVRCDFSGISALLHTPDGKLELNSPLLGRLNLYNLLGATAVALGLGASMEAIRSGQQSLRRVPGRLETISNNLGFHVLVDYAHTPDALEKALQSLRELQFKRVICVFGCGGDRDRSKRPLMGKIAAREADLVVITSDNPRREAPEAIMADIETGVRHSGLTLLSSLAECAGPCRGAYILVTDRGDAIRQAIDCASEGDVVYIGGKGHENYQIFAGRRIDFDDRLVAARALEERERKARLSDS